MNSQGRPAILTQIFGDVIRNTLRTNEDQHFRVFLADLVQVLDELRALLEVTANFDNLLDVVVGRQLSRADVDLNEILQEILDDKEMSSLRRGMMN